MKTSADIRAAFLEFFVRHQHENVPSSPLVPLDDPTLLFTNAGMVPFKDVFTGLEQRSYKRATSAQKCIRAGGKHNDLENVGYTARHHTFFEMLGNFSFGDYFKEDAIDYSWEFLTKELGLDPKKLYITVYAEDEQAASIWKKKTGFPDEKIIRIATSDNFWSMGDTGPCGPCSEIFYDHGPKIPGGLPGTPEEDGDRFVEIWNLVFMQFNRQAGGQMVDLPSPSIDTGMGLERIAAVVQGTHDNYATDIFSHIIGNVEELTKSSGKKEHGSSSRVIADHLRSSSFLIADGVLPSNEGRGYVLRRIMRRAMRHVYMMNYKDLLMHQLVPSLVEKMGKAYPELVRAESLITQTLRQEESRFRQTLERGMKILEEAKDKLSPGGCLPGAVAFKLYDTYGFPLDLTQDALRVEGYSVDEKGFEEEMQKQKDAARAAWSGSGDSKTETLWYDLHQEFGATEFLGYETPVSEGTVEAIVVDGEIVKAAEEGDKVAIITNQTPFYGESGGQMGDAGEMTSASGCLIEITDTQKKLGDMHVHYGEIKKGSLKYKDFVTLSIDEARRVSLAANHSATHLLHEALRDRLGAHVVQKGSLVAPDKLRFDFSHHSPLTSEELQEIETKVNDVIRQNAKTSTKVMSPEEALAKGALALFGEKYGDSVRVVSFGETSDQAKPYSIELCGGTHVKRAGDIGLFKITSEASIASGVRRIEALTGKAAFEYVQERLSLLDETGLLLKAKPEEVLLKVEQLMKSRKQLEKDLKAARSSSAVGAAPAEVREVNGVNFCVVSLKEVPAKDLRNIVSQNEQKIKSGVVVVTSEVEGKAALAVGVTQDLVGQVDAVSLVKIGAEAVGGKGGGGKPTLAQAGGPEGGKCPEVATKIEGHLKSLFA